MCAIFKLRESQSVTGCARMGRGREWADDEAVCGVVVCAQTDRSPRLRNAAADSSSHGFDGRTN